MPRPQASVFIAVSLDGFIARPDGAVDWLKVVEREGEDYGYQAFADTVDTLVFGRKTYDLALSFGWPYAGKRCVVLTHRPVEGQHGEVAFEGSPTALVERLDREGAKRLYVDGGTVIRAFLAEGLIDDLTLSVIPVLLGEGIPLFGSGVAEQSLQLSSSRAYESGLVQLTYRAKR